MGHRERGEGIGGGETKRLFLFFSCSQIDRVSGKVPSRASLRLVPRAEAYFVCVFVYPTYSAVLSSARAVPTPFALVPSSLPNAWRRL